MTRFQRRRTTPALLMVALFATSSLGLGCAFGEFRPDDPMNRKFSLEKIQKRYTHLVRWGKFKQASVFLNPKQREAFLEWAPDHKKTRFTDYEIGDVSVDEEKRKSTIEVTYTAYALFALVEFEVQETQEWSREGRGNNWFVTTSFVEKPPEDDLDDIDGEREAETALN